MPWYAWAMIGLCGLRAVFAVLSVDPEVPRVPWTKHDALARLIAEGLFIWGVVELAT